MKEFYIDSDGIQLHSKLEIPETGIPCPLAIVIHGLTGHMEERHIVAVCETFRECGIATLRVEMYGHGKSGGRFEDHTIFKWINNGLDVIDYAKKLDFVTDLYLCGHSQGGLLAMFLAGMHRDDIKALIPLSPGIIITDGARNGHILGHRFDPEHVPDRITFGAMALGGNYLRTAQLLHEDDAISAYGGPVLLIHGDADITVPISYSIRAAEKYRNCTFVTIPGDTHCYDRHLELVTETLRQFLDSLSRA